MAEISINEPWPEIDGIIMRFNKTPYEVSCGPFYELRWAYGCPFDCSYCYLRGTMRGNLNNITHRPLDAVLRAIEKAHTLIQEPVTLNSGELSDSLMIPKFMEAIADKVEELGKHQLVTLSKAGLKAASFLYDKHRDYTIASWSINAPEVAKIWENRTAPPEERIEAAGKCFDAGYRVRVRIDPMFPIQGWKEYYGNLVNRMTSRFSPEKVILGTPRGLRKTIMFSKDRTWTEFFNSSGAEKTGWGLKMSFELRKEMYGFMYDRLQAAGTQKERIVMCKETLDMWNDMNLSYTPQTCHCYGRRPA
jgi:spore photoproduct lyase